MTLAEIDDTDGSAVAGYWAAPWARKRDATTRALVMACRWGSDVLGLTVLTLMTLPGNVASERVAHKAGFVRMGVVQDSRPSKARDPEARHAVTQWVLRSSRTAADARPRDAAE